MKANLAVWILIFMGFALKAQDFEKIEPFNLPPYEIICSITEEARSQHLYEISWEVPYLDSLASRSDQPPTLEMHCFVRDSKGLVGFYKGLSTPMKHCAFQTEDSVVEVFFRFRKLPFSRYTEDGLLITVITPPNPFNSASHRNHEFESVLLQVDSTREKQITLVNDTNTVSLVYGVYPRNDPLGYPTIMGWSMSSGISLDRYYMNTKTGRITTGQKWVNRKGIRKLVDKGRQFYLICPSVTYVDTDNREQLGSDLISSGKVNLKRFNLKDFKDYDLENYPY